MRKRSFLVLTIAFIFILTVLSSAIFIAEEAHHDCCGDECPVCQIISAVESTFKVSVILCTAVSFVFILGGKLLSPYLSFIIANSSFTLISLKVKLSN